MTAAPRAPWSTRPLRKRQTEPDPVTPEVRATTRARARGLCEMGCGNRAEHAHHRQLRRFGNHSVVNIVWLCDLEHRKVHQHPAWSYRHGWLVHSHDDPATAPLAYDGRWVLLTADGGLEDVPDPAS